MPKPSGSATSSRSVWTPKGLHDCFVLVFLHVGSRRVFVTRATAHPNSAWITEQAKVFCRHVESAGDKAHLLFHDGDTKLTQGVDDVLRGHGIFVRRLRPLSPNLNAFVERWIQSIKHECLNHFIALAEAYLNYLVQQYVEHYLSERPHQGLGNALLIPRSPPNDGEPLQDAVDCHERLGGLLKFYA